MDSHSGQQLVSAILEKKVPFLSVFFIVFLVTYAALAWADLLPEPVSKSEEIEKTVETNTAHLNEPDLDDSGGDSKNLKNSQLATTAEVGNTKPILPNKLIIDSLDRTVPVLNPTSRKVSDLDEALLSGTVRHPDSATLERSGTIFILGHSSYLPLVNNKNFQALNGIENLKWGDTIRLQSETYEYVYRIDKVYRANAKDTTVPIAGEKQRLVLATCNSFGSIDDRYMVEAELLEVRSL